MLNTLKVKVSHFGCLQQRMWFLYRMLSQDLVMCKVFIINLNTADIAEFFPFCYNYFFLGWEKSNSMNDKLYSWCMLYVGGLGWLIEARTRWEVLYST